MSVPVCIIVELLRIGILMISLFLSHSIFAPLVHSFFKFIRSLHASLQILIFFFVFSFAMCLSAYLPLNAYTTRRSQPAFCAHVIPFPVSICLNYQINSNGLSFLLLGSFYVHPVNRLSRDMPLWICPPINFSLQIFVWLPLYSVLFLSFLPHSFAVCLCFEFAGIAPILCQATYSEYRFAWSILLCCSWRLLVHTYIHTT